MSERFIGTTSTPTTTTASGIWSLTEHNNFRKQNLWPTIPRAVSVLSAQAGEASATVTFTAPDAGSTPITEYIVTSSPGNITASGASSPITVTGLTIGTEYTFTIEAINAAGKSSLSSPSNAVTPYLAQQIAYTTPGTYSFIVPAGLNPGNVSVVLVGAGGSSGYANSTYYAGGGGALRYRNNITGLTAGQSIPVVVGSAQSWDDGTLSSFGTDGVHSFYVFAGGGRGGGYGGSNEFSGLGGTGTPIGGTVGGGNGGSARFSQAGGGGAGGYSGNGGNGTGSAGSGGGGGGGASGNYAGGGGGVGILGEGASGAGGVEQSSGGGGGSGGTNGGVGASSGYSANGGVYGGGAGGAFTGTQSYGGGASGAVRVIYSTEGVTRAFPSTNAGDL